VEREAAIGALPTTLLPFYRRFSEAKSHDVGFLGARIFPQALIPGNLEIICKVSGGLKNI
jgi:hypothetical protein